MSTITFEQGALKVRTPYNASLVAAIKSLPSTERKYDPNSKSWLVNPQHGSKVSGWIEQYLGEIVFVPQVTQVKPQMLTDIFEVRYIGQTKERGTSERSAMGYYNNNWSIVFLESVLREWFDQGPTPLDETNLYAVLAVSQLAPADVIRSNYRRLARQWHPDVCKEPDAQQQFIKIQHAYEILSDTSKRAKYNAGLALASQTQTTRSIYQDATGYRSPLRCGLILAEGHWSVGNFAVSKILQWEDITDARGRTLVTSWRAGADAFSEAWV